MKLHSVVKSSSTDTTWVLLTFWKKDSYFIWRVDVFSPTLKKIFSRSNYFNYDEGYYFYKKQKATFNALSADERRTEANRKKKEAKKLLKQ